MESVIGNNAHFPLLVPKKYDLSFLKCLQSTQKFCFTFKGLKLSRIEAEDFNFITKNR